jgi:hypothetical protein
MAANKLNASKSSGPQSAEGKAVASKNAVKHGLTAQQILVPGESADEFEALVQRLISEFVPMGELELQLVERISTCLWRQRRIYRIESEVLRAEHLEYEIRRLYDFATAQKSDIGELFVSSTDFVSEEGFEIYESSLDDRRQAKLNLIEADVGLGKAFNRGVQGSDTLSKLSRYEAGIERALYKALHELQRLQARRGGEDGGVPQAIDIDVSTNT